MRFIKKQLIQESVEETKEELTESVDKNRSYDYDNVAQTIAKVLEQHGYQVVDDLDTETDLSQRIISYSDIEEEFRWINPNGLEIQAEDVDNALAKIAKYFKLEPKEVKVIEDAINKSYGNAASDRKEEFYDDIDTLKTIIENSSSKDDDYEDDEIENERRRYKIRLFSPKVIKALADLIYELEHSNYTGLEQE